MENRRKSSEIDYNSITIDISPWLANWLQDALERDIRKMTRAIERLGDNNCGYLQEELLYCSQELMQMHSYITLVQVASSTFEGRGGL